jgi:hypothetical protein
MEKSAGAAGVVALIAFFLGAQLIGFAQSTDKRLRSELPMQTENESANQRQELMTGDDNSRALSAAWKAVRKAIKEPVMEGRRGVQPDGIALARFLGFVEGRLKVTLPKEWEDAVMTAECHRNRSDYWIFLHEGVGPYHLPEGGIRTARNITLSRTDGALVASSGNDAFRFDSALFKREGKTFSLNVLFDDERCYAVIHQDFIFRPYQIFCMHRPSGRLLWTADALNGAVLLPGGGGSDADWHFTWLTLKNDTLYVFGASRSTTYVEGFSSTTGENQFRFSTSN